MVHKEFKKLNSEISNVQTTEDQIYIDIQFDNVEIINKKQFMMRLKKL
jgi:hypothetical protein